MSGEVVLVDPGDSTLSRLVRVASQVFQRPGLSPEVLPMVLVGGLAVTIRVARDHRATKDVDLVADSFDERIVEYLSDGAGPMEIGGVSVDVISTDALPASAEDLPDSELDRLFVLGHRWALESAEPVQVSVVSVDGREVLAEGAFRVATSAALVACKLHAISDRRDARSEKRESDALDLYRLIGDLVRVPMAIRVFDDSPFDLATLVSAHTERWFVSESLRTARLLRLAVVTGPERIEPADLSLLGRMFNAELHPH